MHRHYSTFPIAHFLTSQSSVEILVSLFFPERCCCIEVQHIGSLLSGHLYCLASHEPVTHPQSTRHHDFYMVCTVNCTVLVFVYHTCLCVQLTRKLDSLKMRFSPWHLFSAVLSADTQKLCAVCRDLLRFAVPDNRSVLDCHLARSIMFHNMLLMYLLHSKH